MMIPEWAIYVLSVVAVLNALWSFRNGARLGWYRGYFDQKQINAGRDPREVMRRELGAGWWWFR
jgi:hypothetical protein